MDEPIRAGRAAVEKWLATKRGKIALDEAKKRAAAVSAARRAWGERIKALGLSEPHSVEVLEHLARVVEIPSAMIGGLTAGEVGELAAEWVAEEKARLDREAFREKLRQPEGAEVNGSVEGELQAFRKATRAVMDEADAKILALAADTDIGAEDRMQKIIDLDRRVVGWPSTRWGDLLKVDPAAVRQWTTWKTLRAKQQKD